jgi:H+/Cl- antiporter ClcA
MAGTGDSSRLVAALSHLRQRMLALVVVVGVVGGLAGAAFVGTLHLLQHVLWPEHNAPTTQLLILTGVGIAVAVLVRWLGSPGDVELLVNNIHVDGGRRDLRELRSLLPVSLLCVAAGGAMGPEAPLVQTTGGLGTAFGWRWRLSREDVRILTITGMAAGFTVLFGAPLGAALFALEILHRRGLEYYEALIPAIVGSICGLGVYTALGRVGIGPVWQLPEVTELASQHLLWAAAVGVVGAGLAVVFTYGASGVRWLFAWLPATARPIAGGVVLGLLGLLSPYALTFGEFQIDPLLASDPTALAFLGAAVAKLAGTTVTLGSGWRGGFIIPLFFVGAAVGGALHTVFPDVPAAVLMAGLMAATNVGVTKTTIGTTLVVTEMSGLHLLPTTIVASVVALLLTNQVGLISTQRARVDVTEGDEPRPDRPVTAPA